MDILLDREGKILKQKIKDTRRMISPKFRQTNQPQLLQPAQNFIAFNYGKSFREKPQSFLTRMVLIKFDRRWSLE